MFRHPNKETPPATPSEEQNKNNPDDNHQPVSLDAPDHSEHFNDVASPPQLKELIEKNLKWSQIIYEQNRKINNKLLWMVIGGWVKIILILVPLILALIYLPAIFKDVWKQYGGLLGGSTDTSTSSSGSMDNILKILNIDPAKREQIKTMLR